MRLLICFFSCIIIFSCAEPKNVIVAQKNANQIATGSIEEAGLNKNIINSMDSNILNNIYPNIHSVLIAKNNKDWQSADSIRHQINELGFEIKDGKEGYKIVRKL